MATVTVDVDVPDEGGLIRVRVTKSNVWRLMLNGTTVPQRKAEEWVRRWRRRAQQGALWVTSPTVRGNTWKPG